MGDRNRENRYNTYQRHLNDTEEFTYPLITKALEAVSGLRFKIFNLTLRRPRSKSYQASI